MSTFKESESLIKRAEEILAKAERRHALLVTNAELIDAQDGEYCVVLGYMADRVSFELREGEFEEQLTAARAFMRELLGTWKDEFKSTWNPYGNQVMVSWRDKNHDIQLWMECKLETFPKSLYPSDKCSWVDANDNPTKSLVCELPGE